MANSKYQSCLVLGGVGDAMGYKNGSWEFSNSGPDIHKEMEAMGGVSGLHINDTNFIVSDDTVMAIATAKALVNPSSTGMEQLLTNMAKEYIECMKLMRRRAPGNMCMMSVNTLRYNLDNAKGYEIPFNDRAGGCGAAMRAIPIGLRYPLATQLDDLIAVSVETGRMTHHHPTGYLGSLAAALFTSFAVQKLPIVSWGSRLMDTLPKVWEYVERKGRYVEENRTGWPYFTKKWTQYLADRSITDGQGPPVFPDQFGVVERDAFYRSVSYIGRGGSSGHDAPLIAYDALLGAGSDWIELCKRAVLHGGDSDSTGILACSWFGALYGYDGVPLPNYKKLEFKRKLENLADKLKKLASS